MPAPSPPQITNRPRCSDQTLEFWWQPPANNGGSAIDHYTLQCSTISFSNQYTASSRYALVSGLANGTEYSFFLTATNATATSSPANFTTVEPGFLPGQPFAQGMTRLSPTTALAFSQYPSSNGDALVKWFVTSVYSPTSSIVVLKKGCFGFSNLYSNGYPQTYITGLTEPWYKFYVQAVNDPGYSYQNYTPSAYQYYQFPYQYNSTNQLKVWIDGAQMYQGSYAGIIPNYGQQSEFYLDATPSVGCDIELNGHYALSKPTSYSLGVFNSGGSSELPYSSISIFYVGQQVNTGSGYLGFGLRTNLRSENDAEGFIGYGISDISEYYQPSHKPSIKLGDTVLYLGDAPNGPEWDIWSLTRNGDTTNILFGWNGSTILENVPSPATMTSLSFYYSDNIHVAELLYYTYEMNQTQRQNVEGYLAWKWGLVGNLPSDHPYKNVAP